MSPCLLHMRPIPSPLQSVNSTNYKSPHYVLYSNLLTRSTVTSLYQFKVHSCPLHFYIWQKGVTLALVWMITTIATDYGLDDRMIGIRLPGGTGNFSLRHRVQTGSEAHPASYPMGTWGSFPGGKTAGAWRWPLTSIYCRGQRISGAIPPLLTMPSWRGA
jgi:hypothetical protein